MVDYCRKKWKTVLLFLLCCGIFASVFWLYGYPAEAVFYGGALCLVPLLGVFFYGYGRFRRRTELLGRIKGTLPLELDHLPCPQDRVEELLDKMLLALNSMRMEAEENRMRSYQEMTDYYTMWVHQIKTPIAALRLLLADDKKENREALNQVFRVEEYVEMVLGYLRTEDMAGDMHFEECSLDKIIREQIHKYAPVFIGKKLSLDYPGVEQKTLTDPKWLGFVIGQCLSNALKYTKTGGIRIYSDRERPYTLVIEDSGCGISPSDLPRIFEKGFTGCNGRAGEHSTGIGLYLSKKIMKKLEHEISVESIPGVGTRVYLSLGRRGAELF